MSDPIDTSCLSPEKLEEIEMILEDMSWGPVNPVDRDFLLREAVEAALAKRA